MVYWSSALQTSMKGMSGFYLFISYHLYTLVLCGSVHCPSSVISCTLRVFRALIVCPLFMTFPLYVEDSVALVQMPSVQSMDELLLLICGLQSSFVCNAVINSLMMSLLSLMK